MNVNSEFERVWPWLAAAVQRYGETHTKEQVWGLIKDNQAQLHPLPNGAYVTNIVEYPTGLKEMHYWLAGGELGEILSIEDLTTAWAKSEGCSRMTIRGRHGWTRKLPHWRDVGSILIKDIS